MDTKTGKIYDITSDENRESIEKALGRPLVPIPAEQLAAVRSMHLADRVAWAQHRLARQPGETDEDCRKAKNAMKRQRRERRG